MYILLVYDILDDGREGRRILRHVFKLSKQYLHHIQKSVFEGDISKAGLEQLKSSIKKIIRKDKDSVLIFKARDSKWLQKDFWGRKENETFNIL